MDARRALPAPGARRHLVICRVGDESIHREWIGDPSTRSYDVWLDYHGDDPGRFAGDAAWLTSKNGITKWPRIGELLEERRDRLAGYDAVWCPDDDLRISPAGVERLFEIFGALHLDLAQPALTPDSSYAHLVTLRYPTFLVRFTNFVEVMGPIFSARALEACRPTFSESASGWGLEYVWMRLLGEPRDRAGVIDAVPMTHTRKMVSGSWYKGLALPPAEEMARLAERHGIPLPYRIRQFGGIPRGDHRRPRPPVKSGLRFLARLALGTPRNLWTSRTYWRAQVDSVRDR